MTGEDAPKQMTTNNNEQGEAELMESVTNHELQYRDILQRDGIRIILRGGRVVFRLPKAEFVEAGIRQSA